MRSVGKSVIFFNLFGNPRTWHGLFFWEISHIFLKIIQELQNISAVWIFWPSGEFRFFGPSIHVSSALRLCGNASCELSQGKLLGMEKNWRLAMFMKSPWNAPNVFLTDGSQFLVKWFQTLSFLCVIICDLRWSKLWRFGRMLVQWGTKTGVTTLQHVQGVFVKYWPRQGVFLFGTGNPKYSPWVCSGLISKSKTIRNSFKVVDQTTFGFCKNPRACYILNVLRILQYR